ncbi:30S ribosomal protein S16 [Candidatus Mycoplasma haematolamae str. Purdue]|uniref:Small ribosomal subunit protein bS16 n=1 Tax=Mycoplasma haematolamae (strain Purdue) TaxID=1212765 RepID=I7C6F6_MYCHA|nr:30S ribosomal protein S16 [Candidatus Mycoplasma haematolamae str. Purdue]
MRIRLKRMGKAHDPFYRIVAMDSRRQRDSAELSTLGHYNPRHGHFQLNVNLYEEFLKKGAQPTKNLLALIKAQPKQSNF